MLNTKKFIFCLVVLCSIQRHILSTYNTVALGAKICSVAAAGGILWGAYHYGTYIHDAVMTKLIDRLETELADDVVLLNTPNSTIQSFAPQEREKKFRKKAWLLERKARIIEKLEAVANASNNGLTDEHKKTIHEIAHSIDLYLEMFNLQKLLPMFSQDNPYQDQYKKPTLFDKFLENRLVSLLISCGEPQTEQPSEEPEQESRFKLSKKRILAKMALDLGDIAYKKFEGWKFRYLS